ncbi:MAG TPA: hypothetical protein V6C76_14315 [Drouetiella sp.]
MNDVELKALELKRKAWEVLDGKAEAEELFQELYRLERGPNEFFVAVAQQLEEDNGRWAATSGLPNAEIKRDASNSRIEEISFHALDVVDGIPMDEHPGCEPHELRSDAEVTVRFSKQDNHKAEFQHVGISKSAEEELSRASFSAGTDHPTVIVWRSDYGDRAWIEQFADDVNNTKKTE